MIAHQRNFADGLPWWNSSMARDPWAAHGVHNHAIMVSGDTLEAWAPYDHDGDPLTPLLKQTPREFCDATLEELETSLNNWADGVEADSGGETGWFHRETYTGFIILDIEHPYRPVHFRLWFNQSATGPADHYYVPTNEPQYFIDGHFDENENPILLDHMIDGFNRRIRAARKVFKEAKIAVYPMIQTNNTGECNDNVEHNVQAWEYASVAVAGVPKYKNPAHSYTRPSWLNNVDYVCVQLYPRFGECDPHYDETTTKNFVTLAVEVAKRIADMEEDVGMLPMLAFNIQNPNNGTPEYPGEEGSCEHDQAATVEYVAAQIEVLREYAFVGAPGYTVADQPICFWDGDGLLEFPRLGGPQTLEDFMDALCFTPCDLNGTSHYFDPDGWGMPQPPTCVHPDDDGDLWLLVPPFSTTTQPVDPFHLVFDLTGDRYVSEADVSVTPCP